MTTSFVWVASPPAVLERCMGGGGPAWTAAPPVGRTRERVLARCDSAQARWIAVVLMGCIGGLLIVLAAGRIEHVDWPPGRLGWSLALLAAAAFIARGVFLGRPVTAGHATSAARCWSPACCDVLSFVCSAMY